MSKNEDTLTALDGLSGDYAKAQATLADRVSALEAVIATVYRRRLPAIRTALAAAVDAQAALAGVIGQHPHLFEQPRTMTLHGVKFGFRKSTGSIEWDDDAQVIKLIRKHLPDQADVLIHTEEAPVVAAINELDVKTLRMIGCTVEEAGDAVFVKTTDSELRRLLKRILKEGALREPRPGKEAA